MAAVAPSARIAAPGAIAPDVVARFRAGDREAFLIVYDAHLAALRPLVARFFPRPFEREEATQEIWLTVHRMAGLYDPERGPLLPWLRTLAANRCKELLRARGRRPDPAVVLDEDAPAPGGDPEDAARIHRVREAVARFAATLTPEEAAVFRLSLLEERSHDEVAAAAGINVRRCKYLRHKLLVRAAAHPELREALGEVTEP